MVHFFLTAREMKILLFFLLSLDLNSIFLHAKRDWTSDAVRI